MEQGLWVKSRKHMPGGATGWGCVRGGKVALWTEAGPRTLQGSSTGRQTLHPAPHPRARERWLPF